MVPWWIGRKRANEAGNDRKKVLTGPLSPTAWRAKKSPDGQPRKGATFNSTMVDTWFWEITAMVFSTLCFAAAVAVLGAYDQKPSPSFPKGLTLNAIVSILATGSKASLLCMVGTSIGQLKWIWVDGECGRPLNDLQSFDDASRGPWGSLRILFHWPNKKRSLVSLGALITIGSLAFDPFMQQIVNLSSRQVDSGSYGARVQQVDVPWRLSSEGLLDTSMLNSLNAGVWASGFDLDPICPSGNCTWPGFQSAGWCSKCQDFTSNATIDGCDISMFNSSSHEPQVVSCRIFLPDGTWINLGIQSAWVTSVQRKGSEPAFTIKIPWQSINQINDHWGPYFNKTILGVPNPLTAVAMAELEYPHTFTTPGFKQVLTLKSITECVLSPCVQTYNINVSGGVPRIRTSSSEFGEIFLGRHMADLRDDVPPQLVNSCWKPHRQAVDFIISQEVLPLKFNPWENSTHFAACPVMWDLTAQGLLDTSYNPYQYNKNINKWDGSSFGTQGFRIYEALQASSFDGVMSNIAASLTKYAHENFGREFRGAMIEPQVYVVVNWYFIILPSLLIVLGAVFLTLTVRLNRQRGLFLWKSSLLPVVYRRLAEDIDRDGFGKASDMETSAIQRIVAFGVEDEKRRLVIKG